RSSVGEVRYCPGVRDDGDLCDAGRGQRVDRQTNAVERQRPVQDRDLGNDRRQGDVDEDVLAFRSRPHDLADRVDVPLHQMPAQPVAEGQRALQVHAPPLFEVAERGPFEGGADRLYLEKFWTDIGNRKTDTIYGDAVSRL